MATGGKVGRPHDLGLDLADMGQAQPDLQAATQFGIGLETRAGGGNVGDPAQCAVESATSQIGVQRGRRTRGAAAIGKFGRFEFGGEYGFTLNTAG